MQNPDNNQVVTTPTKLMWTIKEAKFYTGISESFARRLALEGKINATRAGSKILISAKSLVAYLENSTLVDEQLQQTTGIRKIEMKKRA